MLYLILHYLTLSNYIMILGKPLLFIALTLMPFLSVLATESPNSEILFYKEHVLIENGHMLTIDSVAIQINNKYGEEDLSVVYDKLNKLKNLKAWVEDCTGKLLGVLPKGAFQDRNLYQETTMYNDLRERVFNSNYPVYPHRFFYTSTVYTESILSLAHWEHRSTSTKPMALAELWIHRPINYPVQTLIHGAVAVLSDTTNQRVNTRYLLKPTVQSVESLRNPAVIRSQNFVWVVPEQINYGIQGSSKTWADFGNWVGRLNQGLTLLPDYEQSKARAMVLGLKDTISMVRVLYHYMQDHTRYVSVQLGIGGLKSYPASDVSINKFGDCKSLSNYMKALLESVGIVSHFVLVNRDEYPSPFYQEFPTSQFNHMMLVVPVGKDTIWLENTSSNSAMGYVDVTTQNRLVLLVDGKNSRLIRTPALNAQAIFGRRSLKVECTPDGDATITVQHVGRGWEYEYMNSLSKDIDAKSQFKYLDPFIQFKHYEMNRFDFMQVNRDSMYSRLEMQFRMPRFLQTAQTEAFLPQIPIYKGSHVFFKPESHTLQYPIPVCETDTVIYQLPANLNLSYLPDAVVLTCPYGKYRSEFTTSGSLVIGIKSFFVQQGTYEPEAYRILYDFIQKVAESEKKMIVLKM